MAITAILFLILSISLHELGHAFFMRKHNIGIKEISLIGISGYRLFTFRLPKLFGATPITARIIPLGAYVMPTDYGAKKAEFLSLSKYGEIMGAGIALNFLFGTILLLAADMFRGQVSQGLLIVCLISVLFVVFLRYSFYIIPVLGILIVYILLKGLFTDPKGFVTSQGSIVQAGEFVVQRSISWIKVLETGGLCSIGLGLFNCLPFSPLDGGNIASKILETVFYSKRKAVRKYFMLITIVPIALLILLSIGGDVVRLFKYVF
jgi:membrane-associated protease RseP (regulator of RpoE activity)